MDNGTKSLILKVAVALLSALAGYLHANVPDAQLYAFATDGIDAATILYGWYRSYGTNLVPKDSIAVRPLVAGLGVKPAIGDRKSVV